MNKRDAKKRSQGGAVMGAPHKSPRSYLRAVTSVLLLILFCSALITTACSELVEPRSEPYYAETAPPPKQEFRWSNGGQMPKSFDPARASAPPETDIIRAIFEGLTETDPKTLEPVPAGAVEWTSTENDLVWTFDLRRNARWSNGDVVEAQDFVRSWKRLPNLGMDASHPGLLANIAGLEITPNEKEVPKEPDVNVFSRPPVIPEEPIFKKSPNPNTSESLIDGDEKTSDPGASENPDSGQKQIDDKNDGRKIGVEALDKFTLRVTLITPDKDFPTLIAHPIFRPIHHKTEFEEGRLNADIITNGAFRVVSVGSEGVTLDRSESYWDRQKVELERVRFVPAENAEKALEAYRAGEVDAVTNSDFEPLALKLLQPFEDFQRSVHSALNFYEINRRSKPFNDRRIREALAISIDRKRLTDDEMDGATRPALSFLPHNPKLKVRLTEDTARAQELMREAGYPDGENFPVLRLVINRNNIQQRIARSVAEMWKQNLKIETRIIVLDVAEFDLKRESGEYDIIRRGVVLPTADETANMLAIFPPQKSGNLAATRTTTGETMARVAKNAPGSEAGGTEVAVSTKNGPGAATSSNSPLIKAEAPGKSLPSGIPAESVEEEIQILTEEAAINELFAIPLYFPTSYSLVKPYVLGFEINTLDAPSLKDVRIDSLWQRKKTAGE